MAEEEGRIELRLALPAEPVVPPTRYATPARYLPILPNSELVTLGDPARGWLIDECAVAAGPLGSGKDEKYALAPMSEWTATALRYVESAIPSTDTIFGVPATFECLTTDLWVYQDRIVSGTPQMLSDLAPMDANSWLGNINSDTQGPPDRKPRPARELPSLIGRTLRGPLPDGGWMWLVAVTEPREHNGDIVVQALTPQSASWWRAGRELDSHHKVGNWPLHLLWTY